MSVDIYAMTEVGSKLNNGSYETDVCWFSLPVIVTYHWLQNASNIISKLL